MQKVIYIALAFLSVSCLRIDDLAYLNDNTIDQYYFDDYPGEYEIEIPAEFDLPDSLIQLVSFKSQMDGEASPKTIYGVFIGSMQNLSSDTVILYLHGQTNHLDYYWTRAKLLANTGFPVFMIDYRGFGLSEGTPSEDGMYADTKAALEWLDQYQPKRVVLYGFSLGSAPATYAAAFFNENNTYNSLILESPFSSAENLAQESTIINIKVDFLSDLGFNNADWIKEYKGAFCWLHGRDDDYIKISNGEIVYKNHEGSYKEAHRIAGAKHGHNGVPETMGFHDYLDTVRTFIVNH